MVLVPIRSVEAVHVISVSYYERTDQRSNNTERQQITSSIHDTPICPRVYHCRQKGTQPREKTAPLQLGTFNPK